jgi:YVTN family beta-propeller protein
VLLVVLLSTAGAIAAMLVTPVIAAASPLTPFAYVTGSGPGADVAVINTSTNAVVANVATASPAQAVATAPNGAFVYVTLPYESSVAVIDTSTNAVVATVPVGSSPDGVAITPNGAFAYVASTGPNSVSVINTSTNAVVATVPVGSFPEGVAITPNGAFAYVTNVFDNSVSVINTSTNAVVTTVPVSQPPYRVAITPNGAFAYVTGDNSSVSVINTSTNAVTATVPLSSTWGVAITPNGAFAYTATADGKVSVIDTSTNAVVATVVRGNSGDGSEVAITPPIAGPAATTPPTVGLVTTTVTPPAVKILSGPPRESANQKATFTFKGIAGGIYECSIDDGAWVPCASGQTFGPFLPGDHLFRVRETLNHLTGPADSYSWTIDLPRACVLRVARARVFAFTHQHRARLVIRYKTYRPAKVTVSYGLAGSRGALALGSASSHFATAGVFRLPKSLDKGEIAKLRATSSIKVSFSIPEAPNSCNRYYTKRLTIPKKVFGQTVWFQSDSVFAP